MKAHGILGMMFLVAVVAFIGLSSQAGAQVDTDLDGFDDDIELYLGTDPLDNCPDDSGDNAWPLDLNNDTNVNLIDVVLMKGYIGLVDTDPAWDASAQRRDFNGDGVISVVSDVFGFYRTLFGATCNGGTPNPPEWPLGDPVTMGIDPEVTDNTASALGDLEQCVRIDVDPEDFEDGTADHTIDVYVTGDTPPPAPTGYDAWVTYPPDRVDPVSWDDLIKLPGAISFTQEMPSRLNAGAAYLGSGSGTAGDGTILRMNLDVKLAGYACFAFSVAKAYSDPDVIHPTVPRAASFAINTDCATDDSDTDEVIDMCDNCLNDPNPGQEDFDGEGLGNACDPCIYEPDCDGDQYSDYVEVYVSTDPLDACPDAPSDDAWPPDIAGDEGCGSHNGQVNILDVLCYKPKLTGPYDARYNLNADGNVNILDVLLYKPLLGASCTNPP